MRSQSSNRARAALAIAGSCALLLAACGSSSKSATTNAATTTAAAGGASSAAGSTTTAASGGSAASGAPTTAGGTASSAPTTAGGTASGAPTSAGGGSGSAGCPAIDTSVDAQHGKGAGRFVSDLQCADKKPLKATGDPIVVGFQNPEGDPNGSFPEYSLAAQAAADYINNELGGLGADVQNGKPGRPIKLEVCKMAISPDDSQRCANELLAKKPAIVFSSLNFFGNQFPIYAGAKTPVIVITPITVGDFTSPGVYSIGGGGGCLGVHTGLIKYTVETLKAKKVSIPWANTPPGVVCYYDLEAKPMDVLSGKVKGDSPQAGSVPDLQYIGVPIKPATPDITSEATQVLDFKPDAIIFSGQGADCWNLVAGLGNLGWTPAKTPLVLSGACIDFDAMKAAGDLAKGVYFVGATGSILNEPSTIKDPVDKYEAQVYQSKPGQHGLAADQLKKGFATAGFTGLLSLWQSTSQIVVGGGKLTSDAMAAAYKNTSDDHLFGSTPLSCSKAPTPYVAVCNAEVSVSQWDGTQLNTVVPKLSAIDLVAGTAIKPGP